MKQITLLLSFFMLFIVSCKKEDSKPEPTPKNISGVYTITGLQAKVTNGGQVNVYDQLTECQQNDTWGFSEDGGFLFGGVATQTCQDGDYSGSWSLTGKVFSITAQQNTTNYQLESFDGKAMVLSISGTLNGDAATYFLTFTKK